MKKSYSTVPYHETEVDSNQNYPNASFSCLSFGGRVGDVWILRECTALQTIDVT